MGSRTGYVDEMMQSVRARGGVVSTAQIVAAGWSRRQIALAIDRGALERVRRGWLAAPDALRRRVCVHYSGDAIDGNVRDSLPRALAEMLICGEASHAIVCIDSALNKRLIHEEDVTAMRTIVGQRRHKHLERVDPTSQSGLETLVRLVLTRHRVKFRTQVQIDGVGRIDILVGERLVLELDGKQFHTGSQFEVDRERDFALILRGYLVLRVSYTMIMQSWPRIEAGLLELIRRGEHRWGSGWRAHQYRNACTLQDQTLAEPLFGLALR